MGIPPMNPQMGAALAALTQGPPTQAPPPMGAGMPQPSPTGAPPPTGIGAMDAGAGGKDLRSRVSAVVMGLQELKGALPSMAPALDGFVAQLMDAAKPPEGGLGGLPTVASGHASEGAPPVGPGM